jgi:hypothetical protein
LAIIAVTPDTVFVLSALALPSVSALELVSDTVLLSSESSHELVSVELDEGSATAARFLNLYFWIYHLPSSR